MEIILAGEVIRYVELVCCIYASICFPLSTGVWTGRYKLFHKVSVRADKCF